MSDNKVYYARLITGEELLFRLEADKKDHVILAKPLIVMFYVEEDETGIQQQRVRTMPWMMQAGLSIPIYKSSITIAPVVADSQLTALYIKSTTGLETPTTPSIILP